MLDKENIKEFKKEDLYKLLINKMKVIDYNIRTMNSCTVDREFFYTSVQNGEIRNNTSFKIIDLFHEFIEEIHEYCKINSIQIKTNHMSKQIHFIKN